MNPLAILAYQQTPDIAGAYREGQSRNALRTYGGPAIEGDENALRQLAQFDPELALRITSGRLDMDLARSQDSRAERVATHGMKNDDRRVGISEEHLEIARQRGREAAAEHASRMSAAERAADAEEAQRWGAAAAVAMQSPEAWSQFQSTFGDDMPEEFRGMTIEQAPVGIALMTGVTEGLTGETDETAEMRNLKFRAEQAGLEPGTPAYEQFMGHGGIPRTMQLTTTPDGGVSFTEGPAGVGGVSDKPPSGFAKVPGPDGTHTLAPIAGGPGTQLPAELAARIAVADDGLKALPEIMKRAEAGDLTGVLDWAWGTVGRGQQGADRRDIKGASEAITRLLTGAGLNAAEVANEGWLYTPQITDDAATVVHKLKRLEDKLLAARDMALQGRGGGVAVDSGTGMGKAVTEPNVTGDDIDSVLERYR